MELPKHKTTQPVRIIHTERKEQKSVAHLLRVESSYVGNALLPSQYAIKDCNFASYLLLKNCGVPVYALCRRVDHTDAKLAYAQEVQLMPSEEGGKRLCQLLFVCALLWDPRNSWWWWTLFQNM